MQNCICYLYVCRFSEYIVSFSYSWLKACPSICYRYTLYLCLLDVYYGIHSAAILIVNILFLLFKFQCMLNRSTCICILRVKKTWNFRIMFRVAMFLDMHALLNGFFSGKHVFVFSICYIIRTRV